MRKSSQGIERRTRGRGTAAWTIEDGQNNTEPLQTVIDTAAQRSQLVARKENEFIEQVKQQFAVSNGYTVQADGTLYRMELSIGGYDQLIAYDTITTTGGAVAGVMDSLFGRSIIEAANDTEERMAA